MEYTVVITKKHCEGRQYQCTGDCPLFAAIAEQLPEFPLYSVGGNYVRDNEFDVWHFNSGYLTDGWNMSKMMHIEFGNISHHVVTFSCNKVVKARPVNQVIRYVSVPETIKSETKNLILS